MAKGERGLERRSRRGQGGARRDRPREQVHRPAAATTVLRAPRPILLARRAQIHGRREIGGDPRRRIGAIGVRRLRFDGLPVMWAPRERGPDRVEGEGQPEWSVVLRHRRWPIGRRARSEFVLDEPWSGTGLIGMTRQRRAHGCRQRRLGRRRLRNQGCWSRFHRRTPADIPQGPLDVHLLQHAAGCAPRGRLRAGCGAGRRRCRVVATSNDVSRARRIRGPRAGPPIRPSNSEEAQTQVHREHQRRHGCGEPERNEIQRHGCALSGRWVMGAQMVDRGLRDSSLTMCGRTGRLPGQVAWRQCADGSNP